MSVRGSSLSVLSLLLYSSAVPRRFLNLPNRLVGKAKGEFKKGLAEGEKEADEAEAKEKAKESAKELADA